VRGAVVLGHDAARGLAQAMADAMLAEAGCRDLLAEPIAEAVTAKRAAPFVWQERQRRVRARARFQGRAAWRGPPANVNRQGATCDIPDGRSCALKNGATEGANGERAPASASQSTHCSPSTRPNNGRNDEAGYRLSALLGGLTIAKPQNDGRRYQGNDARQARALHRSQIDAERCAVRERAVLFQGQ
jgi:hypothetical protein